MGLGTEYVRVLVNHQVQPLEFCRGEDGVCEFGAFVIVGVTVRGIMTLGGVH